MDYIFENELKEEFLKEHALSNIKCPYCGSNRELIIDDYIYNGELLDGMKYHYHCSCVEYGDCYICDEEEF